jgi:hypothetical protein
VIDLVCLAADKCIEAAVDSIFRRPEALGVRHFTFETVVHPRRDPGCFHEAGEFLAGYVDSASRALVVLDRNWEGVPPGSAAELEARIEDSVKSVGPGNWIKAVVIDPELEAWIFTDSPHVPVTLGWPGSSASMRTAMAEQGLWEPGSQKPSDPKRAVDWALFRAHKPRSSSLYRELARKVALRSCTDRAFLHLRDLLRGWFVAC